MEEVETVGIVKEGIYRKRSPYTSRYHECNFQLETGENVWCQGFIPDIRKGWKVVVVGNWHEGKKYIDAVSVERFVEKLNYKQLEIMEFLK
jgi:hypothetical protein